MHVSICPFIIIVKGDEIARPCDRHSNETMNLRKHATKYKNMRKWMANFEENLRIVALNLYELTRFLSPNLSIYSYLLEFCTVLWSVVMLTSLNKPPVLSPLIGLCLINFKILLFYQIYVRNFYYRNCCVNSIADSIFVKRNKILMLAKNIQRGRQIKIRN